MPKGETRMALLKYSKMTRTYEGFIVMPKGEEHEVRIRVTSPGCQDFTLMWLLELRVIGYQFGKPLEFPFGYRVRKNLVVITRNFTTTRTPL